MKRPRDRRNRSRIALSSLLAAHAFSQTGNAITVLATPFYVLAQGGSGLDVGLASAAATVPIIIGGPLGGVLVDRLGHRISSVIADAASGLTLTTIAILASTASLPFWGFLLLIFFSGLLDTPGATARHVLLPQLSSANGIPLGRTVGIASGVERVAMLIGAPLGGVLVTLLGPTWAFAATASAFAIAALLVLALVPPATRPAVAAGARVSYCRDLAAGFRFVGGHPLLRMIVGVVFLTNLLDAARFSVLLPVHASEHLQGALAVGILTGALGGGALVGSLLYGFIGQEWRRRPLFVAAFIITGGPLTFALAWQAPLSVLVALGVVTGVAAGVINPIIGVLRLELAPPAMRARVQSLMIAGSWAGIPIGALLAGTAIESIGLTQAFLIIGVIYTLTSLTPLLGGAWRRMGPFPDVRPRMS